MRYAKVEAGTSFEYKQKVGIPSPSPGEGGPAGLSGDLPYGLDIFRVLSPIRPGCEVSMHRVYVQTKDT